MSEIDTFDKLAHEMAHQRNQHPQKRSWFWCVPSFKKPWPKMYKITPTKQMCFQQSAVPIFKSQMRQIPSKQFFCSAAHLSILCGAAVFENYTLFGATLVSWTFTTYVLTKLYKPNKVKLD